MVAYSGPGWRLAPSLVALFEQAKDLFPDRATASDGSVGDLSHQSRGSDHNPNAEGWVTAADVTHDPDGGFDAYRWAEQLRTRRDARLKYVISNRRMFSSYATATRPAWTWGPYTGANPHDKHTHVSVLAVPPGLTGAGPWFDTEAVMTPAQEAKIDRLAEAVGVLREHEKAHYDAVQARVGALSTELDTLRRQVDAAAKRTDPDADLSRKGSEARRGVREVIGLTLREDFDLAGRLARIESAVGLEPPDADVVGADDPPVG